MRKGYSLLELIIVLAVLAGMAAMVYPMLQPAFSKAKLRGLASNVANDVLSTRLKAMQDGESKEFKVVVPDDISVIRDDVIFYPDGTVDGGTITLQQDKLSVDIKVNSLTQSAKVGDCYNDSRNIRVFEEESKSTSTE